MLQTHVLQHKYGAKLQILFGICKQNRKKMQNCKYFLFFRKFDTLNIIARAYARKSEAQSCHKRIFKVITDIYNPIRYTKS